MSRTLPPVTTLSEPWFAGCRAGRLRLQHCADCQRFQFYPRILCADCGSRALAWRDSSGLGRIASFTVVRRAVSAAYDTPFVAVLVDLWQPDKPEPEHLENVELCGQVATERLLEYVKGSRFVIVPSLVHESFGMAAAEALWETEQPAAFSILVC